MFDHTHDTETVGQPAAMDRGPDEAVGIVGNSSAKRQPSCDAPIAGPQWRDHLHRLDGLGLVLLPIGAGADRKGPVDPTTGDGLKSWQSHPGFTPEVIGAMNQNRVIAAGIHTGPSNLDVLDLDGAAAIEWILARGLDPFDSNLFRITRTTDPNRFKIVFRLTPEQRLLLPQDKVLIRVGEKDADGKRQALELYSKNGAQVVAIGAHPKSGGWYDWAGDPSMIGPPSDAWLQVLIALRDERDRLRGLGDGCPRVRVGRHRTSGEWRGSSHRHPCPVCGRDHSSACTTTTASNGREFVSCFHGGEFSPPLGLKRGDVVTGKDGRQWGFVETYDAECLGDKSLFVAHEPREIQTARHAPRPQAAARHQDAEVAGVQGGQQPQENVYPEPSAAAELARVGGRSDLDLIRDAADRVVAEDINRSRPQYLHRLRELVEADLSVPARDDLYRREIGEAIIRRDGIESYPFIGGQELPDDDDEWLVEGLILAGALNIVGADPKAGKTLFSVALIANLLHGCDEFIGRRITWRPQTIVIVGPDQPVKLWKRQLRGVGLVEGNTLDRRIVRLWDSSNPWLATPEGIAELRQVCSEHPGALVLFDSFAKVSEKLGIDENSREAAEVLTDIERACIVHGCTPLVIHHNAKAAGRMGVVNGAALRGNGAIRANASQLLILTLIEPDNPKDPRRRLVTEGRGTEFIDSVIQLEDGGGSWRHVCEFSEHRGAAKAEKAREKLTERQMEALEALEGSEEPLTTAQVWAVAYPGEPWVKDANESKQLVRTLGQLVAKRLVVRHPGTANRPTWSAA